MKNSLFKKKKYAELAETHHKNKYSNHEIVKREKNQVIIAVTPPIAKVMAALHSKMLAQDGKIVKCFFVRFYTL